MPAPAWFVVDRVRDTERALDLLRLVLERLNRLRGWSGTAVTDDKGAAVFDFPEQRFDFPPVITATCAVSGQSVLVAMVGAVTQARATVRVAVVTAGAVAPGPAGITVHLYARQEGRP